MSGPKNNNSRTGRSSQASTELAQLNFQKRKGTSGPNRKDEAPKKNKTSSNSISTPSQSQQVSISSEETEHTQSRNDYVDEIQEVESDDNQIYSTKVSDEKELGQ